MTYVSIYKEHKKTNKLMVPSILSQPPEAESWLIRARVDDVAIDVAVIVMLGVGAGTLVDVEVVVAITFDLAFDLSRAAEMLPDLLPVVVMDGTTGIAAEVAVMTALEFTLSAPLEDSSISC